MASTLQQSCATSSSSAPPAFCSQSSAQPASTSNPSISSSLQLFAWTGGFLIVEGLLFLLYVKVGKFRHRDFMLGLHSWRGDEQVLDVGCGRGLLLAGAAKRIAALSGSGHATGIDVWLNVDMGGNSRPPRNITSTSKASLPSAPS